MAEVKKDLRRYREVMRQLPKVEEFSDEEVEKRSGKASQSYWTSGEVTTLQIHVPRKVEKLHFLLKQSMQ